jgi:hypothetical protein
MEQTKRREWVPIWEIPEKYGKFHPPHSMRVYAFKPKSGKIVTLYADAIPTKENLFDGQAPLGWRVLPNTVQNPQKWVTLTFEQAKKAADLCRANDWPLKKGVAAVIDPDQWSKVQLAKIFTAPEIFVTKRGMFTAAPTEEAKWDDSAAAFFASARKSADAPAAQKASASPAKGS